MNKSKFLYLSWKKLHQLCFQLLKKIEKKKLNFDRIVCISRGGLVVSRIFSDFLELPISNFTIVSYTGVEKSSEPKIMENLQVDIKDERILLIDEVVDKGITLKKALNYLAEFKPKKIHSLAPVIKPWSEIKPDFWQMKTDKWIIFPYEIKETIKDLEKMWGKEGLKKQKIKKRLIKIGLSEAEVEYFSI